jgi:hypothetical protein
MRAVSLRPRWWQEVEVVKPAEPAEVGGSTWAAVFLPEVELV